MVIAGLQSYKGQQIKDAIDELLELAHEANMTLVVLSEGDPGNIDEDSSRLTVWVDSESRITRFVSG